MRTKNKSLENYHLHSGRLLEREMEAIGISVEELSEKINVPVEILTEIIRCEKPVTEEIANAFERVYDTPANVFINVQKNYDKFMAEIAEREKKTSKPAERRKAMTTV
jgi:addiction module HigA family antidote